MSKQESATKNKVFTDGKNIYWVIITGAMAIMVLLLMLFPQNLGGGITSVFSLMLWWGMFGLFLFRYIDKKGVVGFIAGSVLGMLIHIFAPVLAALLQ
jgi:hypothetical protein